MRFDGKTNRQRAKTFKLTELSGVTVPAHEGADVTIIKTADLVKTAFEHALLERKLENAQWPLTDALREAMEKIVEDSTIGDKLLAMREAALQYVDALINAVNKGVKNVIILNGKVKHSILLELFTYEGFGTMIKSD